jgi:transcription initiation factor TFIIIB Brf1 subunit/transcription initiation factor TFIIB
MHLFDALYEELDSNDKNGMECLCRNNDYFYDHDGVRSCSNCGLIKLDNVELSSDDHEFSQSSINNNIVKASLGTTICGSSYLSKINSWGIWMNNYKEKTFLDLINTIQRHCQEKVPKIIIDNAITCMKEINNAKHKSGSNKGDYIIIRGINKKSLIAASVFYSSKRTNYPLTNHEISKLFDINLKDLTKGEKIFEKLIPDSFKKNNYDIHTLETKMFVVRYSNLLNMSDEGKRKSCSICDNLISIEQTLIKGSSSLQALACIYLAIKFLDLKINLRAVLSKIGTDYSDAILNKIFKGISKYEKILCDDELTKEWIDTSNSIRLVYECVRN